MFMIVFTLPHVSRTKSMDYLAILSEFDGEFLNFASKLVSPPLTFI